MKRNTKALVPLSLVLAAFAEPASAGTGNGTIVNTLVYNGLVYFDATGVHTSNPACSTTGRWVFAGNTANGQAMLAQVLTAYSLGKTVKITGTGDCGVWPDSETVSYVISP